MFSDKFKKKTTESALLCVAGVCTCLLIIIEGKCWI